MTIRRTKYCMLLVAALVHLIADVAFAGGAVFCVGPDDHRAIEFQSAATAGCPQADADTSFGHTISDAGSGDCSDSPLHPDAELAPKPDNGSDLAPIFGALPSTNHRISNVTTERGICPLNRATGLPPGLRAHRTIVLIL